MSTKPVIVACQRCGIKREVAPYRGYTDLCRDCKAVMAELARLEAEYGCGTWRGYYEHLKRGEVACVSCCTARNARQMKHRRRRGVKAKRVAVCGTDGGYFAHRRRREDACDECKRAHTVVSQRNAHRTGTRTPREIPPCGEYRAERRHRRLGEDIDAACREAARVYARDVKRRQRERERNCDDEWETAA